jgi:hypothetical protein
MGGTGVLEREVKRLMVPQNLDFFFLMVLGYELRASHLLDRHSTTGTTLPVLSLSLRTQGLHLEPLHQPFSVKGFLKTLFERPYKGLSNYFPRLALNHDPPDLCLLSS